MYTPWQLHSCQGVLIVEYVMNLHRESFENFKSNICHKLRSYGDLNFLTNILIEDIVKMIYEILFKNELCYYSTFCYNAK